MIDALNRNLFFVKEHIGLLRAAKEYDIVDPGTGNIILECREENLGFFTRLFRFSDFKRITPFDIRVRTPDKQQVMRITRGIPVFFSRVMVFDERDNPIGEFRQRPVSVSGTFDVLDANGKAVCKLKGRKAGWDFLFMTSDDVELARVTKKWAGLGKELFTNSDNYIVQIDEAVPRDSALRQLILASMVCVDLVVKA